MATLHITQYANLARDSRGNVMPIAEEPALASGTLTYSTSAASSAFGANTRYVYVQTDGTKAHVAFGTSPTATATSNLIVADDGRFFSVPAGQSFKIAAYDGSS